LRSAALSLLLALALAAGALAGTAIRNAELAATEDAVTLSAEIAIEVPAALEEAVARGVPLYFVLEFELTRPRWYWFDETVAARTLTYRLSYHALTRQYRLSTGALHQSFATLDEAVAVMSRLRDWPVAERAALASGTTYTAGLRLRLESARLPKPIQVGAIGAPEWSLGSEWLRWPFPMERAAK